MYASNAWWGFSNANDRQKIFAFIRCCIRTGFCSPDLADFHDLYISSDEKLFNEILTCPNHILWTLLDLSLLDLSAAFDSIDHDTLLQRLQTSYGLGGNVIAWFASYLTGRTQYVRIATSRSISLAMLFGVPQGSVLGESCSSFMLLNCCSWWSIMDFIHTAMQTTLRSTGFATRRMLTHCKSVCRSALTKFSPGW